MIRVRPYRVADAPVLRAIFNQAVLQGAASVYDAAQRQAWAAAPERGASWEDRLGTQITLIAEKGSETVGFMTLGYDGHLDLAFVRPDHMGTGVAAGLHDRMLAVAEDCGLSRLETEASHLARRFLIKQGWLERHAQTITLDGVALTNFVMEKRLAPPASG